MFAHRGEMLDIAAIQQVLRLTCAEGCVEDDTMHFTLLKTSTRLCISQVKEALASVGIKAIQYKNDPPIVTAPRGSLYEFSIYKRICWAKIGASNAVHWSWSSKAGGLSRDTSIPSTQPEQIALMQSPHEPTQIEERFEESNDWLEFYDQTNAVY